MNIFIFPTDTCYWIATPINDIDGYNEIYTIKQRTYNKPLAILVGGFNDIVKYAKITQEQINFMKDYPHPFTILVTPKENLIDKRLKNKEIYKKIAFRVAHTQLQRELIDKHGPLFLTSANVSWDSEIYSKDIIQKIFSPHKENITFFSEDDITPTPSSNIFVFVWKWIEIKCLRKNY